MITVAAYDIHVEQLFEKTNRLHAALAEAGLPYRVVGGVAVFLQVFERDPGKARLTQDVDIWSFRAAQVASRGRAVAGIAPTPSPES